jgi:hypothetical protein
MSPFLDRLVRLTYGDIQAVKQSNENFSQIMDKKFHINFQLPRTIR